MGIYNLGGGSGAPVLEARTVTPSTSQQIIKPSRDEYDGLSQVTVEATPLETRTVNPSTSSQTITPSGSNIGFSTITVNPYRLQSKSVTPSTSSQTVSPDSGYNGLSSVSVGGVTLQSKTVSPSTSSQTVKPSSGYTGLSQVTVNAANLQNKTVTPSSSTQYISADSGYYGLGTVTVNRGFYRATGSFMGNGANTISIYVSSDLADYYIVTASVRAYIINSSPSFYAGDTFNGLAWLDGSGQAIFNLHDPGHSSNSALIASNNNGTVTLNFLVPSSALIIGPFANGATYEYEFIFGKN